MPLEIFPQSVALFPNDRQLFTARATYPPPLSRIRFNFAGLVQPDYSIRSSSLAGGVSGEGAFQLVGGVGSVEWTLTASSVPVSPSTVLFKAFLRRLDGVTTFWEYRVLISSSNIVITDELFGTLATLTITPVVGMKIRIEMASGFSLFIDGVLVHSRTTFASAIAYPAIYNFSLSGADPFVVTGPPRIPAPKLSGDWQLSPTDSFGDPMATFTNPAHGSLSNGASALEKIYSGGTVPGQYVVRAQINPGSEIWVEDAAPAGAAVVTSGGVWAWGSGSPTPFSGSNRLKSPAAVGNARYTFTGATTTLQINKGDVLTCHVFIDAGDPVTEIMLQWNPTSEANLFNHRAYWGANSIALGVDGTPSRRFMGSLPPTGVWTRLEVPASLVDLEGRVLNGMAFDVFDGIGSFDQAGEIPGIQLAEALINIPPLQILGELVRTLQPGAKARFQTNYDVAQTANLVTWSVVSGGGSFTQGEFTAPTAPGTTVVRATASVGNQVADLTINVPPVITPSFFAAAPLEGIDWEINVLTMPSFVAAGTVAEGTGNIVPGLPLGLQHNDIMLLFVQSANEVVAAPSGYAAVADSPQSTGTEGAAGSTRLSVFWKRATATETAPTVTDPGDHAIGQILAFRGCIDTGNPWNVTAGDTAASSTSVSIPGDTTTAPNCLVVLVVANATDTATPQTSGYANADLANLTERGDVNTIQGVGGGFAVITGEKAVAGAYGATTATLATASAQARMSIALRPVLVVWTASAGSINSSSGLWTAPSLVGQTAKITATDGVFTVTRDVLILEKFPIDPSAPIQWERRKTVLISRAEDRSRTARVKDKGGLAFEAFEVTFKNKEVADLATAHAFWDAHYPGKRFIFEDKLRGVRKLVYFDSDISHEVESSCAVNFSFRLIEA